MGVSLTKIKQSMLKRIDADDYFLVEKIERYVALVKRARQLNTAIQKEGITINVSNAAQTYLKTHPSLQELIKVNNALIAMEENIFGKSGKTKATKVKDEKPKKIGMRDRIGKD